MATPSKKQEKDDKAKEVAGIPATRINAKPLKGSNQEAAEKKAKEKKA